MPPKPPPSGTRKKPKAPKVPKAPGEKKSRKKARISKLAACIRKTAATARINKNGMPDNPKFNPSTLTPSLSGKFAAVISKIRALDVEDMTTHGVKFKHFLFTDIRESAYGAKALAAFMIAAGFDFRMAKVPKMIKRKGKMVPTKHGESQLVHKPAAAGGCDGFAVLQSLPLWKNPLRVTVKKDILTTYNSRPENINGELLRIIILDSKFKEGIDLKDVKYVHLLEPPIATSDLKQAVGRATRFCGQSGLHFIPNRGWPLRVFTYHTELPGRPPFLDSTMPEQKVDAHALMLKHSGLDLAMINLTKELTVLAINSAADYDLNYKINNFNIEAAILDATDDDELLLAEEQIQEGGAKTVKLYSTSNLTPTFLAKCFKRSSKLFPFSKGQLRATATAMGIKVPYTAPREYYCQLLQSNPAYFKRMQTAPVDLVRRPRVRKPLPAIPSITAPPSSPQSYFSPPRSGRAPPSSPDIEDFHASLRALQNKPFEEFQTGIAALYKRFKWQSPVVKDGCGVVAAGKPGEPVSFTRTQDFVRHYLTPESPFKGLLAWHSVGTGKTCMAVAAATTEFESAGYTILWVTRNALMSDVYKNIFGAVCSIPIMKAIKDGAVVPSEISKAKRMLSRAWLPPITYRMFQNALQQKNELGRMLAAKHADPLHKTFLIMDEVHKLMDGDLSAAESADFGIIQDFIQKSYARSGDNSVRPLLMTATPITDTPRELFAILNTLIEKPADRLMDFEMYRRAYTTDAGIITEDGKTYFQDRVKGLISYLNREYDPTTFAQPVFETVAVPAGGVVPPSLNDLVARCAADLELPTQPEYDDCDEIAEEEEAELLRLEESGMSEKALKKAISALQKTYKKRRSACTKRNNATRKAHTKAVKDVMKIADSCWSAQQKTFKGMKGTNQLKEIEACFGKKAVSKSVFPSKAAFRAAVQERLSGASSPASVSSTGAVFRGGEE